MRQHPFLLADEKVGAPVERAPHQDARAVAQLVLDAANPRATPATRDLHFA